MKALNVGKFEIRLMNKDEAELKQVQAFRYQYLLRDYNPDLPLEGFDDDGYDAYSDTLLVIDHEENKIVGTYRLATPSTIQDASYLTEAQYDLSAFRENKINFVELGRAVVHPLYRNGFVIQLLFLGLYNYAKSMGCKYMIGLCSFHGTDPKQYQNAFALLKRDYAFTDYQFNAIANKINFACSGEVDEHLAKSEMPGLLRMYLNLGAKVAPEGSIDYTFQSCDVLILLDVESINVRYLERIMRIKVS